MQCYQLNLPLIKASTFKLEKAVCNHGLFMMAPNIWVPETKTLQRPLRLTHTTDRSVMVYISHPSPATATSLRILIYTEQVPSSIDQKSILDQVSRMLRISKRDEMNVREFYKVHPQAEERGFSRIFRSPTLFEDVVKSILLCGCRWMNTLDMAEALCKLQPELRNRLLKVDRPARKRKRSEEMQSVVNFPSPEELASVDTKFLNKKCNLGYRAGYIIEFAKRVVSNTVELDKFEEAESFDDVYQELRKIKGFGPFVSANILMCIGSYKRVPQDSETIRHLKEYHHKRNARKNTKWGPIIEETYDKYAPFQCLRYWMELVEGYEEKCGPLSKLPRSSYADVTGSANNTKG